MFRYVQILDVQFETLELLNLDLAFGRAEDQGSLALEISETKSERQNSLISQPHLGAKAGRGNSVPEASQEKRPPKSGLM